VKSQEVQDYMNGLAIAIDELVRKPPGRKATHNSSDNSPGHISACLCRLPNQLRAGRITSAVRALTSVREPPLFSSRNLHPAFANLRVEPVIGSQEQTFDSGLA
jgi:hypothetical protein